MTRSRNPFARILAVIALFAAVVVLVVGAAQAESPAREAATVKVMPLGDSITDGFNVPGGYRIDLWQKIVGGGYSVDFVGSMTNGPAGLGDRNHEGHSGWTIAQIDSNVINWLNTHRPQTILLHIGTNDMLGNSGGAPARLSGLLDRITGHSPDTKVFVSTIVPRPSVDSAVRTFNAAIPSIVQGKVSAGKKVYLVDMYSALTGADLADGVHPNAVGYGKMATRWYNALLAVPGSIGNGTGPTTSATTTPTSPTTTTTPVPGACAATARVVNAWNNGYQAEVTVKNNGSATLDGWTVRMTLANGQTIGTIWGGTATGTGPVSVKNAVYNGSVGGGGSTTFGFVAAGAGSPAVNDLSCSTP